MEIVNGRIHREPVSNLIHSHLPKTGGTWVNEVLREIVVDYRCNQIPSEPKYPTIGFVRNPWAWYVSWYNFAMYGSDIMKNVVKGPTFKYLPNVEFETMLKFYVTPTHKFKRDIAIEGLAWHQLSDWMLAWHQYTKSWVNKDAPFYEHLYDLYLVNCDYIGKTESLRYDLKRILKSVGLLSAQLELNIDCSKNVNVGTKRVDYRTYYTDETAQLVADTHQRIITKHGYTF